MLAWSSFSCQYLAERFCPDSEDETVLLDHTVCICDDDNDVQMASACRHAYIPAITSDHMAAAIKELPDHFSVTGSDHSKSHGTASTEAALSLILARLEEET
jgi:hypothetical protein